MQNMLSAEIWRLIFILLNSQTFRHVRAVCTAWASSNTEEFFEVQCIAAYPLTEEVKKLMPSSDWELLFRQHRIRERISMDEAKKILQDTELTQGSGERFDRADFRVGMQIYIANGPQMKVLLEVLLKLNDNPTNDALVDYDLNCTERCTYEIPCDEYPEMKVRVWLYCVKTGSVLALRCLHNSALSEEQAGSYVRESEVNGSTPITDWNINLEGMLDNANWLDVELRESQKSETESTSSITTEHISCKFSRDPISHDGTVLENEGISFAESDNVLNLLMWWARSGMGQK